MRYLPLALAFLTGCSTVSQIPITGDHFYKRELKVTVNKKECVGVCIAPKSNSYVIKVEADRIDYLSFESCHRKVSVEDQGDTWEYTYTPNDIEANCSVEIISLDKKSAKNGFALVDFETDEFRLPAVLSCDGKSDLAVGGTSICQSKAGLLQSIQFSDNVKVYPTDECPLKGDNDGKNFLFHLNKGPCVFVFGNKSGFHKLTTLGTEDKILEKL